MTLTFDPQGQKVLDLMNDTSESLFLSGKAGTGKSTLIQHFIETTDKNVLVLAPTGVAAINVGGTTIHSFFLYHPGITVQEVNQDEHTLSGIRKNVLTEADIVIIDEISMIRADMLDCISKSMQLTLDNMFPFGNKQMIFVGDLYQLPPIVRREEAQYFRTTYQSPFFFSSKEYQMLDIAHVELQYIYRQDNKEFKDILNAMRIGALLPHHLELLNQQSKKEIPDQDIISLVTTNAAAEEINMQQLAQIESEQYFSYADIDGDVPKSFFVNDTTVTCKAGAQIMMLTNDKAWKNGTLATLVDYDEMEEVATIQVEDEEYEVTKHEWTVRKPYYDELQKKIVNEEIGSFRQMPFKLAWAITIHKAQGLTFSQVIVDLGKRVFARGQTYVALSRVVDLEGLYLTRDIQERDVMVDPAVRDYVGTSLIPQKMSQINQAITNKKDISFVYIKMNGHVSYRTITPTDIQEMSSHGHTFMAVTGYCQQQEEERFFHLGRVFEVRESV